MMSVSELLALLMAELKDDIVGMPVKEGNTIVINFGDGTVRKIIVV